MACRLPRRGAPAPCSIRCTWRRRRLLLDGARSGSPADGLPAASSGRPGAVLDLLHQAPAAGREAARAAAGRRWMAPDQVCRPMACRLPRRGAPALCSICCTWRTPPAVRPPSCRCCLVPDQDRRPPACRAASSGRPGAVLDPLHLAHAAGREAARASAGCRWMVLDQDRRPPACRLPRRGAPAPCSIRFTRRTPPAVRLPELPPAAAGWCSIKIAGRRPTGRIVGAPRRRARSATPGGHRRP